MTSPSNQKISELIRTLSQAPRNRFAFAEQRLAESAPKRARLARQSERDMVLEQHQTLFEYDETMQELFAGDFEEYFKVIEHPEALARAGGFPDSEALAALLLEDHGQNGAVDDADIPFERDPLYRSAAAWADRVHELGHLLYDHRGQRDPDIFRVTINALLVSSKIAYALDIDEEAFAGEDVEVFRAEMEISMRAYTLANIFLQRVRESLERLCRKKFPPAREWERALASADGLAPEIGKRLLELSRKLHKPAY